MTTPHLRYAAFETCMRVFFFLFTPRDYNEQVSVIEIKANASPKEGDYPRSRTNRSETRSCIASEGVGVRSLAREHYSFGAEKLKPYRTHKLK